MSYETKKDNFWISFRNYNEDNPKHAMIISTHKKFFGKTLKGIKINLSINSYEETIDIYFYVGDNTKTICFPFFIFDEKTEDKFERLFEENK